MSTSADRHHGKPAPTAIRKGQFLWRTPESQSNYMTGLRARIDSGFYFRENILGCIVEDLATVFEEATEREC